MKIGRCDRSAGYPVVRLRRLRKTPAIRDLLQETHLSVKDLISPIFVQERITKREVIQSMPGIEGYLLPKSLTRYRLSQPVPAIDGLMYKKLFFVLYPTH